MSDLTEEMSLEDHTDLRNGVGGDGLHHAQGEGSSG